MLSSTESLERAFAAGAFEPFLRHVRFPKFRNLQSSLQIDFMFPITALVGPNGANKSSILRALQGCPDQLNIGNYWFETDLDPLAGGLDRYIHGYHVPSGGMAEVIKGRVRRNTRRPDYFETSRPRKRDGMAPMAPIGDSPAEDRPFRNESRWRSIEKDVVYLDFRQEIPAYDIQFYFNWRRKSGDIAQKKSLVRKRSKHVAVALRDLEAEHELYKANRILVPATELAGDEVTAISEILGREYLSIRIVKHDLFEVEGYTARMITAHHTYSEAFAGSGEFAAIMLVHAIANAKPKSLILMDEPEVSLHPGAQKALMRHLEKETLQKKLQVVIATHSPAIIEDLPPDAIKILDLNPSTGFVEMTATRADPREAFNRLGATSQARHFYVEDELAAEIVRRAARLRGSDFIETLVVTPLPGGADTIRTKYLPALAQLPIDHVVLLDGDQRPEADLPDLQLTPESAHASLLKGYGIRDVHLLRNGGSGDEEIELSKRRRQTLDFVASQLRFLPLQSPEELVAALEGETIPNETDPKQYWLDRARQDLGLIAGEPVRAIDILATQRRALAATSDDSPLLRKVLDLIS